MCKITNIESLGEDYTVTYKDGKVINIIQIIQQEDILTAAVGNYDPELESMSSYIERSIAVLDGYDEIDPNRVLWYTTRKADVVLTDIIEYAIKYEYDKVILELILSGDD